MNDVNETHPFLVSTWVTPKRSGETLTFFERPYWFEMARCQSEMRANEVAECLAIRNRFVQVSRLQHDPIKGSRFVPVRYLPDEETVRRETKQGSEE
jgi:hypothetical protein